MCSCLCAYTRNGLSHVQVHVEVGVMLIITFNSFHLVFWSHVISLNRELLLGGGLTMGSRNPPISLWWFEQKRPPWACREWHNSIGRCGLPGVGVTLLDDVCHWGRVLRSQMLMPCPRWHSPPAVCRSRDRALSSFCSTMSACVPPCLPPWR